MNYEKLYKEALERAREELGSGCFDRGTVEYIFPELKESDDERIRREMIEIIKNEAHEFPSSVIANKSNSWIAWLEKQGEKANIHQDAEDDLRRQHTTQVLEYARSLDAYNQYGKESINKDIAWLKKQGEQPCWKPSEEQLQTLHAQLNEGAVTYPEDKRILFTLYEDLMKIMTQEEKQGEQKETNLVEILKHYPRETELYSPLYGKLWLAEVDEKNEIITCYKYRLDEGCTRAILEQENTVSFYSNGTTGLPDFSISKDCMLFLYDSEKKVEPKSDIEKGKWYVCDTPRYTDFVVGKAYYCPKNGMLKPNENEMARYVAKSCFHLWTIQDAKDGDVLVAKIGAEPNDFIYIFKEHNQNLGFWSHCYLDAHINKFHEGIYHNNRNIGVPATKEQRDMFFQKMHEAGYEWDAEIKELKKSEQKPAWSEEDERNLEGIIREIEADKYDAPDYDIATYDRFLSWLKSIKGRVQL